MAGLTMGVYTYDPAFESMPDGSPIDTRRPLCMCRRCKGEGAPGEL
ncbi:hypothetical protein ACWF9X_05745 [Streptomyces globisporus]